MVAKRKISKGKYLVAFVISASIFVIGILIGILLTNAKLDSINEIQQMVRTQVLTLETQYSIASQNPCNFVDYPELTEELYKISDNLDNLESQLGKNNKAVLNSVEYYSLLETKHWLFLKDVSKRCGKDLNLILFFYSNDEGKCAECSVQGYVLTNLRKTYPEKNIYVYSFNADINNGVINTLTRLYSVKKLPSIVINDKLYSGFKDRDELEKIISIN
ncbi:hypothetical protein HYX18_03200 [Candidatus Woesearchaeota archaeon]|nr:hypothetical protein [Candidatus Woesearchaeota archaeon]